MMRGIRVGLIMASVLVVVIAVAARPAASNDCSEEERDARGRCPKAGAGTGAGSGSGTGAGAGAGSGSGSGSGSGRPVVPPPPVRKTQLEIGGAGIAGLPVLLDGQQVGRSPLTVETTPAPSRHRIEVKKDGYLPHVEWVELKEGERRRVEVKLRPVVGTPAQPATAPSIKCPAGMLHVPGGMFQMGSPEGMGEPDERPQHPVTLTAFCIDRTEVTVAAYAECVVANKCTAAPLTVQHSSYSEEDVKRWSEFCNTGVQGNHPMNCVDWNQADAYCTWASKRLPTEAEWEYAARHDPNTGKDRTYPWGEEAPSARRLNACGNECRARATGLGLDWKALYKSNDGWVATAQVGSFPEGASPVGALDMAGNVYEWTADWYGEYSGLAVRNPRETKPGAYCVARGGGWISDEAARVSAANRSKVVPSSRFNFLGFRCARGN